MISILGSLGKAEFSILGIFWSCKSGFYLMIYEGINKKGK